MIKRKVNNMLALAVLSLLHEKPMHPYEISATMKQRGIPDVIKLNNGSLYSTVESLLKQKWIVPLQTEREGKHPERTIYSPTDAGREGFHEWLRELIYSPVKEYPHFPAALSLIGHIAPQETIQLFHQRIGYIQKDIVERRAGIELVLAKGLARIFIAESQFIVHQLESELNWLQSFVRDIKDGSMTELQDGEQVWKYSVPVFEDEL
ncbi:DNA-binding PadR family transcriptional regulator [Paenibacillus taihuensis]|uniref:DNA-binding PadR family transcriptional regulator n=1 Tax=Paenibacillus taihuensis TaxID=1156355 RepID=A0A3D9RII6_9BACL|nr:PadR family transcriptional regulator [Paenibacillus taihuensis]REE78899.1 DNA-binding PadR family transcriptional regulator [Paenibacillus taihuensis]